jgi:hypothetical protein
MSTQLLTTQEKNHELCDYLESLWFVILYQGLHFVKHNAPLCIDMELIFDQIHVCNRTGALTGGVGKRHLYSSDEVPITKRLKFESKPFTTLIGRIYWLFYALEDYYRPKDRRRESEGFITEDIGKLENCAELKRLLEEALGSEEWPESCDKVEDQYPHSGYTTEDSDTIALSRVNPPPVGSPSWQSSGELF